MWELYRPETVAIVGWDLTTLAGAPPAVGAPAAYYHPAENTKHVVYR